jgi:hypothetical protein
VSTSWPNSPRRGQVAGRRRTKAGHHHCVNVTAYPKWLFTVGRGGGDVPVAVLPASSRQRHRGVRYPAPELQGQSSENKTAPVAILTELVSSDVYQSGALMAGSMMGSLPVAIFSSLFVDYHVSSLTSAVKE